MELLRKRKAAERLIGCVSAARASLSERCCPDSTGTELICPGSFRPVSLQAQSGGWNVGGIRMLTVALATFATENSLEFLQRY